MLCEYNCAFHQGPIEWHHPISSQPLFGVYLCQAHHSLIQGRKERKPGEIIVNKTLEEMRLEIEKLVRIRVFEQGGRPKDFDKR